MEGYGADRAAACGLVRVDGHDRRGGSTDRSSDTHNRVRHDRSAKQAPSPCASPDDYATSALDEPTPEPTSCSSPKTSTSESSTPPPANSYVNSSSTPDATTNPSQRLTAPQRTSPNLRNAGPGYSYVLRHHTVGLTGFEPATP
jgi:hypothetical protein